MKKILVVDEDQSIRELIRTYAKYEGFQVDTAQDGEEAIEICKREEYVLVIMDTDLPNLDGYSAFKEISKTRDIPTMMISKRDEEYDKLFGFEIGIDDYVVKPFSPREVIARAKAIIRRFSQKRSPNKVWTKEGLEVDIDGRNIIVDGEKKNHTPKEFDLLVYFINHENRAISRDQLLSGVWGYDYYGDDRTIDTHIKMLRNTLGRYRKFILTVRGVGYKFDSNLQ